MKPQFAANFLWGAATSAYQFEGARDEEGKSRSIVDNNINPLFADTAVASDHYHRWKEDVALMKELGLNSYRFSISWPRVIPDGHRQVNKKGLAFYDHLIDELLRNGIEPIVTIYHFDLPASLQDEYGGWTSRRILEDFSFYCTTLFKHFGDRVKYWLTINEQSNMFALPYLLNLASDGSAEKEKYQMNHIMMLANAMAINLAHEMMPGCMIGPALGMSPFYPATSDPEDILAARNANIFRNDFFTDLYFKGEYHPLVTQYLEENNLMPDIYPNDQQILKKAKPDYIGINYYESHTVQADHSVGTYQGQEVSVTEGDERVGETRPGYYREVNNPNLPENAWHWKLDPKGFLLLLTRLNDMYHVPVLITENGIGGIEELTTDHKVHDQYRIEFIHDHLRELKRALEYGVKVIGYQPWSFMDLLSTTNGFRKRYGFVYVDRTDTDLKTLNRYKKDSFYWYRQVIATNGTNLD